MQYDAADKETTKKINAEYTLEGAWQNQIPRSNDYGIHMLAIFAQRLTAKTIGFLRRNLYPCPLYYWVRDKT